MVTENVSRILKQQAVFGGVFVSREGLEISYAEWLSDIKEAIARRVPPPSEEDWELETSNVTKVILRKRNFSATGPERIVKKATSLHAGITDAFLEAR